MIKTIIWSVTRGVETNFFVKEPTKFWLFKCRDCKLEKNNNNNLIYTPVPFTKVDRMSKKAARTFATLNSTDALTVYRHNKGNFSQVPVRDTLSTYPSAGLKTKAFAVSFHLLLATSGQSYFRLLFSLQEREQYKCYWKDLAHKTQKSLNFYKKIEKRCQNCTQKMFLSTKWKKT